MVFDFVFHGYTKSGVVVGSSKGDGYHPCYFDNKIGDLVQDSTLSFDDRRYSGEFYKQYLDQKQQC